MLQSAAKGIGMKKVQIDHVNFSVHNFSESVRWYNEIFNFDLVEEGNDHGHRWGILRNGDSMLAIALRFRFGMTIR